MRDQEGTGIWLIKCADVSRIDPTVLDEIAIRSRHAPIGCGCHGWRAHSNCAGYANRQQSILIVHNLQLDVR